LGNIIEVVRVDPDWGPGTKLLGALTALRHPSYLILADDDVRYKPQFVEGLAFAQVQDHTASFSYFTYRASGLTVGQGCDGFSFWSPNVADIYSFFKNHIDGRALFFHDDLWVSFFLATRGIRVKSLRGSLKGALIYEVEHNINALRSLDGPFARETLNQQAVKGLLRGVQVPFGCRLRIHTRAYCDQLVEEPCRRLLNKISRVRDRG
jgi:hypothetical protein